MSAAASDELVRRFLAGISLAVVLAIAACDAPRPAPSRPPATSGPASDRIDRGEDVWRRIDALERAPLPPGNYRVSLERVWFDESESASIEALFRYADEHVVVETAPPSRADSFRIGITKGNFSAELDARLQRSRGAVRERSFLVTIAGAPAYLAVGETRQAAPFFVGGVEYAVVIPGGQFLGTSIEVELSPRPPIAGAPAVAVSIVPSFTGLNGRGDLVSLTELESTVVVPIGAPLLLATHESAGEGVTSTLLSRRVESRRERGALILTVEGG